MGLLNRDPAAAKITAANIGCTLTHSHKLPWLGEIHMPCGGMGELVTTMVKRHPLITGLLVVGLLRGRRR